VFGFKPAFRYWWLYEYIFGSLTTQLLQVRPKAQLRKTQMSDDALFAGIPLPFGGLSNEKELAELCPPEFQEYDNPWHSYASKVAVLGASVAEWQWRSDYPNTCKRQMACLRGLIGTFEIKHEDKLAVAGWMLSVMLTTVPEFVPPEPEEEDD